MNALPSIPPQNQAGPHRVEFFRLPQLGKRDPFFGLSRAWYYKAAALGEIRMVAVRQRGAMRGVRLVVYDSVADYVRRSAHTAVQSASGAHMSSSPTQQPRRNIRPKLR